MAVLTIILVLVFLLQVRPVSRFPGAICIKPDAGYQCLVAEDVEANPLGKSRVAVVPIEELDEVSNYAAHSRWAYDGERICITYLGKAGLACLVAEDGHHGGDGTRERGKPMVVVAHVDHFEDVAKSHAKENSEWSFHRETGELCLAYQGGGSACLAAESFKSGPHGYPAAVVAYPNLYSHVIPVEEDMAVKVRWSSSLFE